MTPAEAIAAQMSPALAEAILEVFNHVPSGVAIHVIAEPPGCFPRFRVETSGPGGKITYRIEEDMQSLGCGVIRVVQTRVVPETLQPPRVRCEVRVPGEQAA